MKGVELDVSGWIGADMCYYQIPDVLNPYDHDTFYRYKGNFYSVVTNIETGEPEYILIKDLKKDIEVIRASASLPLVSRNVPWEGKLFLDGGISDAIPLKRSMADGNAKNVVIMTKEIGYRREPSSAASLIKLRYKSATKSCWHFLRSKFVLFACGVYVHLQDIRAEG